MNGCMNAFGGMTPGELSSGLMQLKGEHPALLAQLHELNELIGKIGRRIDIEDNFNILKTKVAEFKTSLDPHSEREEGVLFPMLGAYIGTTAGPIAVMEYEHDQAKSKIADFLGKTGSNLPEEEKLELAGLIKEAYIILTDHFAKEENVLFPMAERMLTIEEKEELYRKIQEIK